MKYLSTVALSALGFVAQTCQAGKLDAPAWHQEPFKLQVDGVPLDIGNMDLGGYAGTDSNPADRFGHAAPFLADLDGDGKRDLTVGSFAGRFRFYKNIGADDKPKFSKEFVWLRSGEELARVPIYCCVASGPQLYDVDRDGILDLLSGSYDPGLVYWFKGLGQARFGQRQFVLGSHGVPLVAHEYERAWMSNVAVADFYADGYLSLVLGNLQGEVFVWRYGKVSGSSPEGIATTIAGQLSFQSPKEIKIDGGNAVPEYHAAPAVGDWDDDGLTDIFVGTDAGAVYWFRNSGTAKAPEFTSRQLLIAAGEGVEQWVEAGRQPRRGIRAQIQVVDYNKDGKSDILLGDWGYTMTPRANLTADEKAQMQALREKLAAVDRKAEWDRRNWRHKSLGYFTKADGSRCKDWKDCSGQQLKEELLEEASALRKQLDPFLQPSPQSRKSSVSNTSHGHVWVFLHKP